MDVSVTNLATSVEVRVRSFIIFWRVFFLNENFVLPFQKQVTVSQKEYEEMGTVNGCMCNIGFGQIMTYLLILFKCLDSIETSFIIFW